MPDEFFQRIAQLDPDSGGGEPLSPEMRDRGSDAEEATAQRTTRNAAAPSARRGGQRPSPIRTRSHRTPSRTQLAVMVLATTVLVVALVLLREDHSARGPVETTIPANREANRRPARPAAAPPRKAVRVRQPRRGEEHRGTRDRRTGESPPAVLPAFSADGFGTPSGLAPPAGSSRENFGPERP